MSKKFYDDNEGIEREESINNYKELFTDFVKNPPSIEESLFQIFNSSGVTNDKIEEYIKKIKDESRKKVNDNYSNIKDPSLKFDNAVIMSIYSCEVEDNPKYSPYRVLNRNLVIENRKKE